MDLLQQVSDVGVESNRNVPQNEWRSFHQQALEIQRVERLECISQQRLDRRQMLTSLAIDTV